MAEAKAAIEGAVELAPKRARAYFLLTTFERLKRDDPRLAAMEDLAADMASLSVAEQVDLNFALAKAYRDLGDPERSFPRLAAGAALKRKMVAYDEARALKGFEARKDDVHRASCCAATRAAATLRRFRCSSSACRARERR